MNDLYDLNEYRNILHEKIEKMCDEQDYKELSNLYKSATDYLWLIYHENVKMFLEDGR